MNAGSACPDDALVERTRVAHHEAGHAVMSLVLRIGILSASIEANEENSGRVMSGAIRRDVNAMLYERSALGGRARAFAEPQVMVFLAGSVAEAEHRSIPFDDVFSGDGSAHDRDCAIRLASLWLSHDEVGPFLAFAAVRAGGLLSTRTAKIQRGAVAAALLERKSLKGSDVRRIAREAVEAEFASHMARVRRR